MALCPCGSALDDAHCCAPIIAGAPAPTALALMRSRYAAYVRGAIAHVVATHDPATRASLDIPAVTRWSHDTTWLGLEIVETHGGGPDDSTGIVEFVARGITRSVPFVQRERSRFRRTSGHWAYVDGVAAPERAAPKPGRNEPCPCGSARKYKLCHGR